MTYWTFVVLRRLAEYRQVRFTWPGPRSVLYPAQIMRRYCSGGVAGLVLFPKGSKYAKWYLLWGLKSINRTYFGQFGAPGFVGTLPE